MKKLLLIAAALLALAGPAHAQGTIPVAMNVQQDTNGRPMAGALLYLYVVGTLATPEIAFQDVSLTQPLPWPVSADATGRLPMFYLPAGSVHARLTDASGNVQFDYPNVLVIGGATAGGGGGPTVDPAAVASTGDIKIRLTSETLSGWVILNGQTIGNATSGATQLANATAQNLFIYLWTNCSNTVCPVSSGRGSNALTDFNAGKAITLLDMRGTMVAGRDCMGSTCAGRIPTGNVVGATNDIATSRGGAANQALSLANLPHVVMNVNSAVTTSVSTSVSVNVSGGNHSHTVSGGFIGANNTGFVTYGSGGSSQFFPIPPLQIAIDNSGVLHMSGTGTGTGTGNGTAAGTATLPGASAPVPVMPPFILSTYYQKL